MIRIQISNTQKESIEKIYWDWIKQYHLINLIGIINNDVVLKRLIMEGEKELKPAIKKFLLSDYNRLIQIKTQIDEMRNRKEKIKDVTKDYLSQRYKNYRDTQAAKVIKVLNMTVCPYCNQNHINIVHDKNGKLRFWGDLDHFYNKSTYPELSICLYNLIPVCKVCNHLKGSQKSNIINPYDHQRESKIKFQTEFDDKLDLSYLQGKTQNFNIIIDESQLTTEEKEEIELFYLKERYLQLKQNAQEIIVKTKAYDTIYQSKLKNKFDLSDDELETFIFGYTENHLNRVLSKFNLDIMEEFKNEL